jgi:hypothetical protein
MTNQYDFWATYGVGSFPIKEKSKDPLDGFKWAEYTNAPASAETREKWAKMKGNHAVISGSRLIIMDWENETDIFKLFTKFEALCLEHYVVKTGKGYHIYFLCDWEEPYAQVKKEGKIICEVRTGAHYVVGAGSVHPSGKIYTMIGNPQPQRLSKIGFEEMKMKLAATGYEYKRKGEAAPVSEVSVPSEEILAHRAHDKKLDDLLNGSIEGYPSRSEAELALVCKLLFYSATKEQVFSIMENGNIGKWRERPESYKHTTYNRGIHFLSQTAWDGLTPVALTQNKVSAKLVQLVQFPIYIDGECKECKVSAIDAASAPLKGVALVHLHKFLEASQNQTIKWFLPGFVPEKSICMLAAKRASMKTFMALYFGLSAATGSQNVLGTPQPCKVVYLDYENGDFEMHRRVRGLCIGEKERITAGQNFLLSIYPPIRLDKPGGVQALVDTVKATEAKIVVVDTQRRLTSAEENASETSNSILEGLQTAIQATGCSFVLLHHMRKSAGQKGQVVEDEMDEIRGSSDIPASCSVIYYLKRQGTSDKFTLKQLKNRFAPERKTIQLHIEGQAPDKVTIVNDGEVEDAVASENALVSVIWDWLVQERRFAVTTQEIHTTFIGAPPHRYSKRSVADAISVLKANGKIEQDGKRGHFRMILPKKQEKLLKEHKPLGGEE